MAGQSSDRNDEMTMLLAEGRAGLRLTESLILALVDAKILDKDGALAVIEIVAAAEQETAAEDCSPEITRAAAALLDSIANSMAAAGVPAGARPGRRARRRPSS